MIFTLVFTIVSEAAVVAIYCAWHRKPLVPILFTSVLANLITQPLLWISLSLFFRYYLIALLIGELFIWPIEGLLLYYIASKQLRFREAMGLSLAMNLASFALGWGLPI